jgi:hypothetical protein
MFFSGNMFADALLVIDCTIVVLAVLGMFAAAIFDR